MRIWLACFIVLFALAELYEWAKHLNLPLPIYILGGAFLAIASNYDKRPDWLFQDTSAQAPSAMGSAYSSSWDNMNQSQSNPASQQLHQSTSASVISSGEQSRLNQTKSV